MPRRYPVSVPALPSTATRTRSSAAVSAACATSPSVCSRSAVSSSTIAMFASFPSLFARRATPMRATKRALFRPCSTGCASRNPRTREGSRGTTSVDEPRLRTRPSRDDGAHGFRPPARMLCDGSARRVLLHVLPSIESGLHPPSNALLRRESPLSSPGCFQPVAPVSADDLRMRRCLRHRV